MYKELAYYDGKVGTPEEVMIPFNDRSHFFGDGVYDGVYKFLKPPEHIRPPIRLFSRYKAERSE